MFLTEETPVAKIKQILEDAEGIPAAQQVLVFAGQQLKDHLQLADYALEEYSLSDETVIYLQKKLASFKYIYLSCTSNRAQLVTEAVESDTQVSSVMDLLVCRGLANAFEPNPPIIVRRQDGSTITLSISTSDTLSDVDTKVGNKEGITPGRLVFIQAQDGALHIQVHPSQESSEDTYPVYKRGTMPQPVMMRKPKSTGQPFPELVKELCVLPD